MSCNWGRGVLCKLDRLRRSVKDLCSLLELFQKRGVGLISVRNRSTRPQPRAGWSSPSWRPSHRGSGKPSGNARWMPCGTSAPAGSGSETSGFGVRLSPDGKHVEPDPGEQGVLTEIGHLRQSGNTMRGLRPPSTAKRCGRAEVPLGGWSMSRIIKRRPARADPEIVGTRSGACGSPAVLGGNPADGILDRLRQHCALDPDARSDSVCKRACYRAAA
jgi:hypothetical protein